MRVARSMMSRPARRAVMRVPRVPRVPMSTGRPQARTASVGMVAGVAVGVTAAGMLLSKLRGTDESGSPSDARPAGGEAPTAVNYNKVRQEIADLVEADDNRGPFFVRLAWHSSGTYDAKSGKYGSNGGTIRMAPECKHGANAGLTEAMALLEPVKANNPGLSYADLYTLSGVVAIEAMGGPEVEWNPGRKDATSPSECAPEGNLPDGARGADHLRDIFYRMGFNDQEIVALAGAHSMGRCHRDRSGFEGPWTRAPTTFSNMYFTELLERKWRPKKWDGPHQYEDETGELMMLPADMAFKADPKFAQYVKKYAEDSEAFERDFAAAFSKLLALGVDEKAK